MSDLGKAAQARRFYHHVLNGGELTPENISLMVQTIEELEAEVARLIGQASVNTKMIAKTASDVVRYKGRAEAAEAKLATARNDALEDAAKACDDEVDRVEDAIKWGGAKPYIKRCEAAAYAMRDRSAAIRAMKSTSQT